ncbi:hypothetical protein QYE76_009973 [Lolium multiflorum]|uniref:Factor of DNA methylation 1-5/IDN2 domain-containing protein n=1 Tax=Lolium multiflorum TaxID=4521 RepID=A0AAD8TSU5_LOLMU|nr:hypothetical protein QYE76_009973 [Lolium multiflorum]
MADTRVGELLVWPWAGILATTTTTHSEDDTAVSLLDSHALQHPAAVATTPLVEDALPPYTHHHFLVLHFGKSLSGLRAAESLASRFAGAGRTEWHQQQQRHGESACPGAMAVYGWTAVEEDLRGEDAVGKFLSATAATARRAEDPVAAEEERAVRLLEARLEEAAAAVLAAEEETTLLLHELSELRTIADEIVPEMNREVGEENRMLKAVLEAATKEIESKMEKIAQLENLETGALDINTLELAGGGCKQGDHALMLQEKHKLEQREALIEALVSLTRWLNRKLEAGESLTDTVADHQRIFTATLLLDAEQERLKASWLELYKREHMNTNELQENRQELIQGFMENMPISGRAVVGIKRMGQLDERPFQVACKRKYRDDDAEGKAASLVSSWQEEIQKTSWHPFTTIQVDREDKEVVDDNDPKLRQLRLECGDSVCYAVKVALSEINEYSPHGRHVMNEIWNFQEGRKATMTEAIAYILEQLRVADPGLGGCEFKGPAKNRSTSI